jgi:hypothetical protein
MTKVLTKSETAFVVPFSNHERENKKEEQNLEGKRKARQ